MTTWNCQVKNLRWGVTFQKIHSIDWSFCKRNTARVCGFSCFGVVSCFRFVPFVARVALFFPLKRFLSEFARYYGSPHLNGGEGG